MFMNLREFLAWERLVLSFEQGTSQMIKLWQLKAGETEIQLMTNISDIKSVVKLLDYCTDLSFGGINYYLVMDFADGDLEFFVDELCDENDGNGYLQKNTDLRPC